MSTQKINISPHISKIHQILPRFNPEFPERFLAQPESLPLTKNLTATDVAFNKTAPKSIKTELRHRFLEISFFNDQSVRLRSVGTCNCRFRFCCFYLRSIR
jgi:hypothetical protein